MLKGTSKCSLEHSVIDRGCPPIEIEVCVSQLTAIANLSASKRLDCGAKSQPSLANDLDLHICNYTKIIESSF